MRLALSSEVNVLTNMLVRISESDRRYRDFTVSVLRNAIQEVIACFPVYRTYFTRDQAEPGRRDRRYRRGGCVESQAPQPGLRPVELLISSATFCCRKAARAWVSSSLQARWDFVMKFQQVTGPVTAKGIEDTAFYIYNRLVSLNEVGGEPDVFGISTARFHEAQLKRLQKWPHSLLATSTHDTKRSEDVRARINVLSEMPKEWRTAVRRWARFNRKYKRKVDGHRLPTRTRNIFSTKICWEYGRSNLRLDAEEHAELVERVHNICGKR